MCISAYVPKSFMLQAIPNHGAEPRLGINTHPSSSLSYTFFLRRAIYIENYKFEIVPLPKTASAQEGTQHLFPISAFVLKYFLASDRELFKRTHSRYKYPTMVYLKILSEMSQSCQLH